MRIKSNISALNAQIALKINESKMAKNLEKLSSGYRINRSGDDAAGLAISEQMRSQINGLTQAEHNARDGVNLLRTGEGAMQEIHAMLIKLNRLAVQSANGVYDDESHRQMMQTEAERISEEIDRIAGATRFNYVKLFQDDGPEAQTAIVTAASMPGTTKASPKKAALQLSGAPAPDTNDTDIPKDLMYTKNAVAYNQAQDATAGAEKANTQKPEDTVPLPGTSPQPDTTAPQTGAASRTMTASRTGTDAQAITAFQGDADAQAIAALQTDADAQAMAALQGDADAQVITALQTAADAQTMAAIPTGADTQPIATTLTTSNIQKQNITSTPAAKTASQTIVDDPIVFQVGANKEYTISIPRFYLSSEALELDQFDISTQDGAKKGIDQVAKMIDRVSEIRGAYGAAENALDHAINSINIQKENMTAAESRIRDTDMASELTDYTKNNIILQSSQSMLAQANALPEVTLRLLQQ